MSFYEVNTRRPFYVHRGNTVYNSIQDNIGRGFQMPPGSVVPFAGSVAPGGYLLCDGSAVLRSRYPLLFAAIGTTYGAGNGTTTFNLPNLQGRVISGRDSGQTEFDTLGETGGQKTHTLTVGEIPAHSHTGTTDSSGAHTHTGTTDSAGAHTHTSNATGGQGNYGLAVADGTNTAVNVDASQGELNLWTTPGALSINSAGAHTHAFTTASAGTHTHTFTSNQTGGGGAHNNLQPYMVMNYIIKW